MFLPTEARVPHFCIATFARPSKYRRTLANTRAGMHQSLAGAFKERPRRVDTYDVGKEGTIVPASCRPGQPPANRVVTSSEDISMAGWPPPRCCQKRDADVWGIAARTSRA